MNQGNVDSPFHNDNEYIALSQDFFKKYISKGSTVGLGSGSTVEKIVRNLSHLEYKDTLEFVVTSLQIRVVSESLGLKIADQNDGNIDVVIDGADQIDYDCIVETERDIKNIPGVVEVGLFTNHADSYYKIKNENEFECIVPNRM